MINKNFHAFVIITTIVFYVILRSYKKPNNENKKPSNLIYVLLIPITLYGGNYLYNLSSNTTITSTPIQNLSDDLLSVPYPVSSNSSI